MADLLPLFRTLLHNVRTSIPRLDVSRSQLEDALSEAEANAAAQSIFDAKRRSPKFAQFSDEDLWRALTTSLIESAAADDNAAPIATQTAFEKLIDAAAADSDRRWLVAVPVTGDAGDEIAQLLSTQSTERVFVARPLKRDRLQRQFTKAAELFRVTSLPTLPTITNSSFLILEARGSEAFAIRQAMRSLNAGRDALRLAVHLQDGRTTLDPAPLPDEQSNLTEVLMFDVDRNHFHSRNERNVDTSLGPISSLSNAKVRASYDAAARILETCSEDTPLKNQIHLIWRLARSIRVFSRAVGSSNPDIRYLLLIVGLETLLNRADAPITESFSEYGALIGAHDIDSRINLAKRLKSAYNLRSKFVHEGRLPTEQLDHEKFLDVSAIVFLTWSELMKRLLPIGGNGLSDEDFFGKLVKLKFGATFNQAFEV